MDERLKYFIQSFLKSHYNGECQFEIKLTNSIDKDLGIVDEDLDEFLTNFVQKFNIDSSQFNGDRYFGENNFYYKVLEFFIGRRDWMPIPKSEKEEFTIATLNEAIQTGILK